MGKKAMIFGCGTIGKLAYEKLYDKYDIVAWADNNNQLWGETLFEIPIISPSKINDIFRGKIVDVFLSMYDYRSVCEQLLNMGVDDFYIWKEGLFYSYKENKVPEYSYRSETMHTSSTGLRILFVQNLPCIRTNKIASAIKKMGHTVDLVYTISPPPEEYVGAYNQTKSVMSIQELIYEVENGDYDFIHSSNEPDYLTALLVLTNKKVFYDCHDMGSAYREMAPDELMLEHISNLKSAGVVYTSEGIRDVAIKKYHLRKENTFVLENYISEELGSDTRLKKLSENDHEMHCVYEGGVIPYDKESHRFFEGIFKKIAESGVHVHFYTNCEREYCEFVDSLHPNIHYEGNRTSKELACEMSQYDVGLCVLNITEKNRQYLETASPNKIQEYINAGLPVAVGDVQSQIDFVEDNGFGKHLDMSQDILNQIKDIAKIEIERDILIKKGLTIESKIPKLIEFYKSKKE